MKQYKEPKKIVKKLANAFIGELGEIPVNDGFISPSFNSSQNQSLKCIVFDFNLQHHARVVALPINLSYCYRIERHPMIMVHSPAHSIIEQTKAEYPWGYFIDAETEFRSHPEILNADNQCAGCGGKMPHSKNKLCYFCWSIENEFSDLKNYEKTSW